MTNTDPHTLEQFMNLRTRLVAIAKAVHMKAADYDQKAADADEAGNMELCDQLDDFSNTLGNIATEVLMAMVYTGGSDPIHQTKEA